MSKAKNYYQSGFTLIELVIVMLIVGVLSASVAPKYFEVISKYRIDAVAQQIMADMQFAQREAKRTSGVRVVKFNVANHDYVLTGTNDLDRPGQDYSFELQKTDYQVKMQSADFGGSPVLSFDIFGAPNAAGSVKISNGTEIRVIHIDADGNITKTVL